MNEVDRYIAAMMRNVHLSRADEERIEADLRAHFAEALAAGESAASVIARMGTPTEVAEAFMAGAKLRYASIWRRLGAFAVDVAIIFTAEALLVGPGVLLANLVPQQPQGPQYALAAILIAAAASLGLIAVGIMVLYFPILEGRFGQTPGKRLLRLQVLKENGLPIGYREAFLRRLSFYFDFIVVDAPFILFTAKRQRAFDIIAETVVVHDWS